MRRFISFSLSFATMASFAALAVAQEADPAPAPEAAPAPPVDDGRAELAGRLDEVNQRSLIVERKLELLEEEAAKAKAAGALVVAGDKGFQLKSPDGTAFVVKIRGLVHADAREFLDDEARRSANTFLIRRARPLLEATFFDVADFRLMPDFGGGTAVVQDAYVDLRPVPWLKLRAGKFKPPVGLERLQSASAIVFAERALPTALVPNRDVGFQLHGAIGGGVVTYEVGVFNGAGDGGTLDADTNYNKEFAGRLFLQPFKADPYSLLAQLGVGFAGTTGYNTPSSTGTPGPLTAYRSAGQQNGSLFTYGAASGTTPAVLARGRRTRLAPQGFFYYGPVGLLGEWVQSSQRVARGAGGDRVELTNRAWQVAASFTLGGKESFEGVTVSSPLDLAKGTWGALQLGARYNVLTIDEDSFPTFASLDTQSREARAIGVAANWWWSRNIKLNLSFERTDFERGASNNADRTAENVLFQRVQASF